MPLFPAGLPARPAAAAHSPASSNTPSSEAGGRDPAGLSLGGKPASFFLFSSGSRGGQIYIFPRPAGGSVRVGSRWSLLAGQRRSDLVLQLIPPSPVPEMQLQSGFYATNNSR